MSGCNLRKEMLTFEPLHMVNMKQKHEEVQGLYTFELSNLDLYYDYYNKIALFYDRSKDVAHGSPVESATTRSCTVLNGNCGSVVSNPIDSFDDDFCKNDADVDDPPCKLRNALEELIAHYPMAAGRLHFNEDTRRYEVKYMPQSSSSSWPSGVDSADWLSYGVAFIVARADATLSMLGDVTAPHPSLDVLYPDIPKRTCKNPLPLVFIQVTTFTCGSFTLALATHHMLTDGYTTAIFMRNLCSLAKGAGLATPMDLTNRRNIVKPRVPPSPKAWMLHPHILARERASETPSPTNLAYGNATRFSISAAALEALRSRASLYAEGRKCSRYQALLALLWKIRAKCCLSSGAPPSQELPLGAPVNLRGHELPAKSAREYMGNAIVQSIARATLQELSESSLAYVVQKIAASMARGVHMQEHVHAAIDYIELILQSGHVPYMDPAFLIIPCLVNLPFYDTDCGWGRPIYCSRPCRQIGGLMIVLDDPRSKCWNVLAVMSSKEEYNIFQEEIATNCQ